MKQKTYFLMALSVFMVLIVSACGGAAPATQAAPPPAEAVPTEAPQQAAPPTQAPPEQPAATVQTFAPACQAATSCAAPDIKDTEAATTYCVKKIPYQNISVEPGTTFEVLDPTGELKCQDSGTVVDGKSVITCTSKELWTYELKFTNSACAASALATGTGQCQEGQGYDAANNCCAPLNTGGSGSVVIKSQHGCLPGPTINMR